MTDRQLLAEAEKAKEFAYAPYSGFPVGAALLAKSGKVYTGCNVENSSYGLSMCAERVAVFKAVSAGEKEFLKLAIIGPENREILPCGACRQVFFEFAPDLIIVTLDNDKVRSYSLKQLLPEGFGKKDLRHKT